MELFVVVCVGVLGLLVSLLLFELWLVHMGKFEFAQGVLGMVVEL